MDKRKGKGEEAPDFRYNSSPARRPSSIREIVTPPCTLKEHSSVDDLKSEILSCGKMWIRLLASERNSNTVSGLAFTITFVLSSIIFSKHLDCSAILAETRDLLSKSSCQQALFAACIRNWSVSYMDIRLA